MNTPSQPFAEEGKAMKDAFQVVIKTVMDEVMETALHKDPFAADILHGITSLHTTLVPDAIFKATHFG